MYLYEKIQKEKEKEELRNTILNSEPPSTITNNTTYIQMMGSSSHTYGNVLAFIQNYVINLFPEDMFKTIHVNSKIAHRQLRSSEHEYIKKTKPMIIFRPRIGPTDEDKFLKNTRLLKNQDNLYSTWGEGNLENFFSDPVNKLAVKYRLNRLVMYVDVVILLSTLMQQLDYYHYLDNLIPFGDPKYITTYLESYIPQELLLALSEQVDIPLYDGEGRTKQFLDYMNSYSAYPVTFKLQGSTKKKEFFRYYPAKIEATFSDLDKDDGDRVDHINSQYRLNFTIRLEFNATGFYYMFSDDPCDLKLPVISGDDSSFIPVFTDVIRQEDASNQNGWSLFNRASCMLEKINDELDITSLLNSSTVEALKYYKENGLPSFDILDVLVRKQGKTIHEGKDYFFDRDELKLVFKNTDTYHTYTILIYINVKGINELVKSIYELK